MATTSPMRSLERSFEILSILRKSRAPMRLTDIALESGIHLATTQRILSVMLQFGYVSQERYGYTIGVTPVVDAFAFHLNNSLLQIALPIMRELTGATELMSSLSVRVEFEQVKVLRVEGTDALRYLPPVGESTPLHLGSGRILAATLNSEDLATMLGALKEIRLVSGQVVSQKEFLANLQTIREKGYVYSLGEREVGVASVAVPIHSQDESVVASLQVSGPAEDIDDDRAEWCVVELQRASAAVTKRLP